MRKSSALLAVLGVLVPAAPALAHHPATVVAPEPLAAPISRVVEQLTAAPATPGLDLWALGALLATLLALAILKTAPRRLLATAVILCLAVLTFESGVHSVHHLEQSAHEAQCAVSAGTTHLNGAAPVTIDVDRVVLTPVDRLTATEPSLLVPALSRPQHGRAPPAVA